MQRWISKYQKHIWSVKDKLSDQAVAATEFAILEMTDQLADEYIATGSYTIPSEHRMNVIIELFYKRVVNEAFKANQVAKVIQGRPDRRLNQAKLAKLPVGVAPRLPSLVHFFNDKRQWPVLQNRGRIIVKNLRKSYFKKLDRKFKKISQDLHEGNISPADVKKELRAEWKTSKARVETIFRTETTNYFNKIQVSFFNDDEDIIGFLFQANRDSSTTEICMKRHGLIYRPGTQLLRDNTPACHWNCRSELIPLAKTQQNLKLLEDPSRSPSNRVVPPLPRGWVAGRKAA